MSSSLHTGRFTSVLQCNCEKQWTRSIDIDPLVPSINLAQGRIQELIFGGGVGV